jgi:transposase
MGKTYRAYLPEQKLLLPPSLQDWLPENHLAYFVSDVVDQLDLSAIESVYEKEWRGQPPYHPRLMVKLLVYGYCLGVRSSRKIAQRLVEDVPFRVLAADNQPDFRTISDFRKIHLEALEGLFQQVLRIALEAGALKLGRVALDGTKMKANASKHKSMSYSRMKQAEQQLEAEVKKMLAEAEAVDAEEDARYGAEKQGPELPAELQRRQTRLQKIRQAQQALEQRAQERAAAAGQSAEQAREAQPRDKDQYNFSDPESRIMKGSDGFLQAYNAQAAVESSCQLIVGQTLTQAANDKEQLTPLLEAVEQQSGQRPEEVLADSGYCSEKNLESLEAPEKPERKIDAYIATNRQKRGRRAGPAPRGRIPRVATRVERMQRKLRTKAGAKIYAQRKGIVEPLFGQIKQARGIRQFLLRGFQKVQGEWALVCLTHNILKMHTLCYG